MEVQEHTKLKLYFIIATMSIFLLACFALLVLYVYFGFTRGIWLKHLDEHFSTLVVLPFASVFSLLIVVLIRATQGPIEFEALGIKFKGSSGPLILWCFVFILIVFAIKLLW